jgi:hypothetical protein
MLHERWQGVCTRTLPDEEVLTVMHKHWCPLTPLPSCLPSAVGYYRCSRFCFPIANALPNARFATAREEQMSR